jgi:hypothetical protein
MSFNTTLRHPAALAAFAFAALAALAPSAALAQNGSGRMNASENISIGTMSVIVAPAGSVVGSLNGGPAEASTGLALAGVGSAFIVQGVAQGVGDTVELILAGVGSSAKLSVKLAGKTVSAVGVSVGSTVRVVSETTGTILVASGKVLAFIPNAIGEALLSQNRLPAN